MMFGLLIALGFTGLMLALLFAVSMAQAAAITKDDLCDDEDRPER